MVPPAHLSLCGTQAGMRPRPRWANWCHSPLSLSKPSAQSHWRITQVVLSSLIQISRNPSATKNSNCLRQTYFCPVSDFNSLQRVSFLHPRVEIRSCAGFNCCFYSTTTSCDQAPPCRQQLVETKLVEAAAVRRDRSDIGNSAVAVKQHNSGNKVGSSSANMIASSAISSNITNTGNTGLGIFCKINSSWRAELVQHW